MGKTTGQADGNEIWMDKQKTAWVLPDCVLFGTAGQKANYFGQTGEQTDGQTVVRHSKS